MGEATLIGFYTDYFGRKEFETNSAVAKAMGIDAVTVANWRIFVNQFVYDFKIKNHREPFAQEVQTEWDRLHPADFRASSTGVGGFTPLATVDDNTPLIKCTLGQLARRLGK